MPGRKLPDPDERRWTRSYTRQQRQLQPQQQQVAAANLPAHDDHQHADIVHLPVNVNPNPLTLPTPSLQNPVGQQHGNHDVLYHRNTKIMCLGQLSPPSLRGR